MQPSFALFFVTAVAYLLGSLSFAVIVSRLMGLFVCALAAQIIFTGIRGYMVP